MAYPFVLGVNILFILLWIAFRKWYLAISIICIAIGWSNFRRFFQFQVARKEVPATEVNIRLLTYNVRLFNYYQWHKDTATWNKILNYIHRVDPDVVCFQEFITLPNNKHDLEHLKKKMAPLKYSHVYYTDQVPGKINFGIATFSRYPMINKKMISFPHSLNGAISTDIVVKGDTFRLFNCHLQSIRLRKDYNDLLDSIIFNYSERQLDNLKDISIRMKQAFIQRADQANKLAAAIHASPFPVIVCGDFNDTPVSYAYHTVSHNLEDAFLEAGSGTGNTYSGNFPYVRIDFVLSNEPLHARHYGTRETHWSDHYPVSVDFTIREKEDSLSHNSLRKE